MDLFIDHLLQIPTIICGSTRKLSAINPSSRNWYSQHSILIVTRNSSQRLSKCQSASIASSCNLASCLDLLHETLLMEYSAMLSLSHQKLADKAEVTCCLGSPQCSCSDCKMEAAFGGFTILDFHAKSEPAKDLTPSSKIASMGDGHRCKKFPCPICNPGRSEREDLSSAAVVTPQMLELNAHGAVPLQAGVMFFGDGGHTCRKFPCPICNKGRSATLEVEVGC